MRKKILIVAGILTIAGASAWGVMWLRDTNMNFDPVQDEPLWRG